MKPEIPISKQIDEAVEDYSKAMKENIDASRAEVESKIRKEKARYKLQQSRERLDRLYRQAMEI